MLLKSSMEVITSITYLIKHMKHQSCHTSFNFWPLKPFQNAAASTTFLPRSWTSNTWSFLIKITLTTDARNKNEDCVQPLFLFLFFFFGLLKMKELNLDNVILSRGGGIKMVTSNAVCPAHGNKSEPFVKSTLSPPSSGDLMPLYTFVLIILSSVVLVWSLSVLMIITLARDPGHPANART